MTTISFDIVGFDLDGTLVDTSGDLAAAVNVALVEAGRLPLAPDRVRAMIGGGAKRMLTLALEETGGCAPDAFRRLYKMMLDYYAGHLAVHSTVFPGALDALDALAARGVALAVVTNKFERLADDLLHTLGLHDRFPCLIGGDTLGPGNAKPSPAPIHAMIERCGGGRAAFVGDSLYDMASAKAAGIPVVAVSFGFLAGPVAEYGADAVIDEYAALLPALARLGERKAA